jgi:hypothetical protein
LYVEPVPGLPKLHTTPLAIVKADGIRVTVSLDDEFEKRIVLKFEPYQAVRVVTADCFSLPQAHTIIPQTVVEIRDSLWVQELKSVLKRVDHTATFMEKARHFLIPAQDEFIEVVAWEIKWEPEREET